MEDKILINILTRTSGRPNYFNENRKSVLLQTYSYIRQLIHTDSKEDLDYILKSGIKEEDVVFSPKIEITDLKQEYKYSKGTVYLSHRPYNLFLNTLNEKVNDGWIFYLDDDDIITSKNAVNELAAFLEQCDENDVVVFKGSFVKTNRIIFKRYILPKRKTVMKMINGIPPEFGEIGGICFAFHHSKKRIAVWDGYSGSDHRVFLKLMKECKVKYFPKLITSVYDGPNGGAKKDLLK